MKILVTGSSGFIGYHLVKELLNQGHHIVGIDNHNDYYSQELKIHRNNLNENKNYEFHLIDLNDDLSVLDDDYDFAINLAAQAGVRISPDQYKLYEHSNISGYKNFFKFCVKNSLKKIIYASSSSVYGDSSKKKNIESQKNLSPESFYGATKLMNEEYAQTYYQKYNMKIVGLRFFSVYGPYGRPDMAYYLFTKKLLNSDFIKLNDLGSMYRDMTFIDDIIQGINLTIDYLDNKNICCHEIFNLGSGEPIKTKYLLETLERKLNIQAKVKYTSSKNESKKTCADLSKSKKILNFSPQINLDEGISLFLDWYNRHHKIQ